jgi:hypothetical protein
MQNRIDIRRLLYYYLCKLFLTLQDVIKECPEIQGCISIPLQNALQDVMKECPEIHGCISIPFA